MRLLAIGMLFGLVLPAADVPRRSPELVVKLTTGRDQLLSSHKGKVIAVEFLITTCPHCQKASQVMNKLYKEYGPRGFQPIGIAINEMAQLFIPEYRKAFGLEFPIGYAHRDTAVSFLQHPPMINLLVPQMVFIDRNFTIRRQVGGNDSSFFQDEEKNMRQIIEDLLKDNGAAALKKTASTKKKTS
jgi:thiol-disulfide isomerase/thioredoxin